MLQFTAFVVERSESRHTLCPLATSAAMTHTTKVGKISAKITMSMATLATTSTMAAMSAKQMKITKSATVMMMMTMTMMMVM